MSDSMKRTQIYLPTEMYEWLKERADENGESMANQIREAVAIYMVNAPSSKTLPTLDENDPIWDMIGMGDSSDEMVEQPYDELLYGDIHGENKREKPSS